jgi:lipopolysaccharide transport system ATP-binding protein
MLDFKRRGTSIVFVSHNMQAVASLCDQAILLNGEVREAGTPAAVIRAYAASTQGVRPAGTAEAVSITSLRLLDPSFAPVDDPVVPGAPLVLRVTYLPAEPVDEAICDFLVYRASDNLLLYEGHFPTRDMGLAPVPEGQPFALDFSFAANLAAGDYRVSTRLRDTIMRRFLAENCPPAFFAVSGTPDPRRIGYLALTARNRDGASWPGGADAAGATARVTART